MSKFVAVTEIIWDSIVKEHVEAEKCSYVNIDKIVVMHQNEDYATLYFDNQPPIMIRGGDVVELRSVLRGE